MKLSKDTLYSLRNKRVYVYIDHKYINAFSDLGRINAILENEDNEIVVYGEYDDLAIEKYSLYQIYDDLDIKQERDEEDVFLFRIKFPVSSLDLYFYEYQLDEEE